MGSRVWVNFAGLRVKGGECLGFRVWGGVQCFRGEEGRTRVASGQREVSCRQKLPVVAEVQLPRVHFGLGVLG